jgi:hypothetical protein
MRAVMRQLRFRIRTLMIAVAVVAGCLAIFLRAPVVGLAFVLASAPAALLTAYIAKREETHGGYFPYGVRFNIFMCFFLVAWVFAFGLAMMVVGPPLRYD